MSNALKDSAAMHDRVVLRPETPEHLPFLRVLYATTREDELRRVSWTDEQKEAFLASQFHAQHTDYHQRFPDASYLVIFIDGAPAGRLYVHRRTDEIELVDVALLPHHRGSGVGSALVHELFDESAESGLPLRLYVEHENPAKRLYERLGFRVLRDVGLYLHMEWRADWSAGDGNAS